MLKLPISQTLIDMIYQLGLSFISNENNSIEPNIFIDC